MALLNRRVELALLEPNSEILTCPACGELVWQHKTDPITTRISLPSRADPTTINQAVGVLRMSADDFHRQIIAKAERASRKHMSERHPIRLWIWDRFGWDRVLRRWLV